MILKEKDIINQQYEEKKHSRKITNYDLAITMRIDKETLDEFRQIVGEPYQPKIRDLMIEYINRHKYTYAKEEEKRKRVMKVRDN